MTAPDPNGNGSDPGGIGAALQQLFANGVPSDPGGIGAALQNAFNGGGSGTTTAPDASTQGPLAWIFTGISASIYNMLNPILNSLFYGGCIVLGISMMGWGVYLLAKGSPVGQAAGGIGTLAKRAAEVAAGVIAL
jgi:hypothetical protein